MLNIFLRLTAVTISVIALFGFLGCSDEPEEQQTQTRQIQNRILVLRNSSSYGELINSQLLKGIETVKSDISDTRIEISRRFSSEDSFRVTIENFIRSNGDFVIATGTLYSDAFLQIALDNPDVNFAILDGEIFDIDNDSNIVSYIYDSYAMGYYAGVIAAHLSQTGHVAYIGGYEDSTRSRYGEGFRRGVSSVRNNVRVRNKYVGETDDGFDYPEMAYIIANEKYLGNIDIIAHNAKNSAEGIFEAAIDNQKFVIGYGIDETIMVEDIDKRIFYTSVIKRYDVGVDLAIRNFLSGFVGGNLVLDGRHDAIDHTLNSANNDIQTIEDHLIALKLEMKEWRYR